ncbi:uncharacterized protein KRP23_1195 [Phytophthora ramorum]|uniref:Uncharacterized protein n=1 Tax=Phytophthora ramorum TaxID=164328 RepID=H3GL23_PHYRM|nr:hypothetical protein KRP23_1195 [Phytophthora ramorum]
MHRAVSLGGALALYGLTLEPLWLLVLGVLVLLLAPPWKCVTPPQEKEAFERMRGGSNWYKVHEDLKQPTVAAETLDELNTLALSLIARLHQKYIEDPQGLERIRPDKRKLVRNGIMSLKRNFRTASLEENIPSRSGGDTSYVIDKGDIFAVCVRDPTQNNQIDRDFNTLKFVMIHELAHIFTTSFGHDTLFWNNFGFLLHEAVELGAYKVTDNSKVHTPYCGITVSYSPLFDAKLDSYYAAAPAH